MPLPPCPALPANAMVDMLVAQAQRATQDGDYTTLHATTPLLPGTIREELLTSPFPLLNFLQQAGYQHVTAYMPWFGFERAAWWPTSHALHDSLEALTMAFLRPGLEQSAGVMAHIPVGRTWHEAPRTPEAVATLLQAVTVALRQQGAPE